MPMKLVLRLMWLAYELGWSDACSDWSGQALDSSHPIGRSKAVNVSFITHALDPNDILELRKEQ